MATRAFPKQNSSTYRTSKHYRENPSKKDQTILRKEKRNKKEHLNQHNTFRKTEKDEALTNVWNVPTAHRTNKRKQK